MKRSKLLSIIIGFFIYLTATASDIPKGILFQSGVMVLEPFTNVDSLKIDFRNIESINGEKIFMLQLHELPNSNKLKQLESLGIKLLHYIPHHAYFVSTSEDFAIETLIEFKLVNISKIPSSVKISKSLLDPSFESKIEKSGNKYFVNVLPINSLEALRSEIESKRITIEKPRQSEQVLNVWVDSNELQWLAEHSLVMWIEPVAPVGEPEDRNARTLHRSNVIDNVMPGGRRFDGTGVKIAIGDDGAIGPHIDFKGRVTQFTNNYDPSAMHGDMVSGIAAGSGNLDPLKVGQAPGASIFVYDLASYPHVNNAVANYNLLGTTITLTAHDDLIGGIYTSGSASTDLQVYENPQILHVFSAGNAGPFFSGNYIAGWGNISGGIKAGKNVVAVGNLTDLDQLEFYSSRGPAKDGRIKPDICANGESQQSTRPNNGYLTGGWTSAASANVVGNMAQISHAYQTFNNSQNPPGGLIKAAVLNTAEDLGNPGPDFKHGWGRVNAGKAVDLLEQNRYLDTLIGLNDTILHAIPVPSGVAQLRVMIYWTDRAGAPSAAKALVNDLDLALIQGSTIFNPLVLNPTNDSVTLNLPAIPGIDTLNNVEQVVINNPSFGSYLARVIGKTIPLGDQRYFLLYEYIRDEIKITYPMGGEGFVPGETELIRWDGFDSTGVFNVEYTNNNGISWDSIATVPGSLRSVAWQVPNLVGSNFKVRVRKGTTQIGLSDTTFTIVGLPNQMNISFICTDSVGLSWSDVPGATGYVIYKLGVSRMDSIGYTTNSYFTSVGNVLSEEDWFSVAAVVNGKVGRRKIAVKKLFNMILACQHAPVANFDLSSTTVCANQPVSFTNTSINGATSYSWRFTPNTHTFVGGTNANSKDPQVQFSTLGVYSVQLIAHNQHGSDTLTRTNYIQTTLGNSLPLGSSFSNPIFPEPNWLVVNPDNGITWNRFNISGGPSPQTSNAIRVNNFAYNAVGEEDYLVLPQLRIPASGSTILVFSVAHAQFNSNSNDGLRIDVSSNCGETYAATGYLKAGGSLATTAATSANFIPNNSAQWRTDTLILTAFAGQNIRIRFANINANGNNTYLTNIRVSTSSLNAGFTFNGVNCVSDTISFFDGSSGGGIQTYNWNFGVGANPATANTAGPHSVTYSTGGLKFATLVVSNSSAQDSVFNTFFIEENPISDFIYNITDGNNFVFHNTGTTSQTVSWDFGDGTGGGGMSAFKTYTQVGSFNVRQTVINSCGSQSSTQTVNVLSVLSVEKFDAAEMKLYPNPANGFINFEVSGLVGNKHNLQVLDVLGRIVYQEQFASDAKQFKTTLQTSEWNSGVYFIRLSSHEGVSRISFVVQH